MAKQQYRWNLRHKKNNENLGSVYLGSPLPLVDDVIAIGEKKYKIVEIKPGSSYDSTDVFVLEASKELLAKEAVKDATAEGAKEPQ